MSRSPKLHEIAIVSLAAGIARFHVPLIVLGALGVILGPIVLLTFVPLAGPILMLLGLSVVVVGSAIAAGLCARDALHLQRIRQEAKLLGPCISAQSVIMAWMGALISASVGAGFLFFIIATIRLLLVS